ncbi:MAG: cation-translocating P-type ATPase, partial [Erysipelotrichaceae bacterium]|nr:cation-translocating P-type ATPase [Erysipelotrichaceae bacterium]
SDKTGTLTQNKMTITETYLPADGCQKFDEKTTKTPELISLLRYFTLCSDAELKVSDGKIELFGDPTETAMVNASYIVGETKEELAKQYHRTKELAFDSDRKMMSVFYETADGIYSYTKGAPDAIFKRSKNVQAKDVDAYEAMANKALRVLAVGIRKWDAYPEDINSEIVEKDLTFIGLIGMIDPPRLEVKDAIAEAKKGGIRTIMITGDHVTTAKAIAKDLGILNEGEIAITGQMLNDMDDATLDQQIAKISVYARVSPEHKVRIVQAWQRQGQVVAMTGDGVNDSPALKTADIGCAMGITGTDVSKNAADMILTDDNFATIIHAVKEGRGVYRNIKKDVQFLLSSNIGEVLTIFLASLLGLFGHTVSVPLASIHLLWVNLITDTLPAFALGMEPVDDEIMLEKPRPKDEGFFANGLGRTIAWQGLMIGLLTLTSYLYGNGHSHEIGQTMAFFTLSMSQLFHAFNIKSEHSILHRTIVNNKYLLGSFVIGAALNFIVIYSPINHIFNLVPLYGADLMVALALSFAPIVIVEVAKLIKRLAK